MNNFTNSSSVISSDTVIKGKIDFKGELLIDTRKVANILGKSEHKEENTFESFL